jgi:hypothetical protein
MTTGKELQATLARIEGGELFEIFPMLPEIAGGAAWLGEVKDCARSMADWLTDDRDYTLEDLRDIGAQWADSEGEDYYNNINTRVQDLSLWASNDLDTEVQELFSKESVPTLTELNGLYLYAAMRQLWDAVADQAHQNTETGEN